MGKQEALVRRSSQPGKTQTINFYHINDKMYLLDLLGYGYITASEKVKIQLDKIIKGHFYTSLNLQAVFLLVDICHAPLLNDQMDVPVDTGARGIIR